MSDLEEQAAQDGIESYANIREAIVELRNKKLIALGGAGAWPRDADFEEAVLLSHAIWWLTVLKDTEEDAGE